MRFIRKPEDKKKSPFEASVLIDKPDVKVVTASYYEKPFFIAIGISEHRQVEGMAKVDLPKGGGGRYQSQTVLKWNILYNPKVLPDFMPIEKIRDLVTSTTSIATGSVEVFQEKTELKEAPSSHILRLQKSFPRSWELIAEFKKHCGARGWGTSDIEDSIRVGDKNHNFLWIRTVSPSKVKEISEKHQMVRREGSTFKIVDVAYIAWLLTDPAPSGLYEMIEKDPELARRTAVYDFSKVHLATPTVTKLNKTDSEVFQEFENFSQNRWNLRFAEHA
jgi:hypothetical protein